MNNQDLSTLKDIHTSLSGEETIVAHIENPAMDVERSLVSFLKHRLEKLQESVTFEDEIKDAIRERLPEATFTQLGVLLDALQRNSNTATEKVLAPFLGDAAGSSPLLPDKRDHDRLEEERAFGGEDPSKQTLQAMHALHQLIDAINSQKIKPDSESLPEESSESDLP